MTSFQAAGFPFGNADLSRAWSKLKLPSIKLEELIEVHRRNASALSSANRVMFEGLTTLAQRQGELIKATVNDCSKVTYDLLGGASLAEKATKQADGARAICVSSVAGLQELSDIVLKTNVTAVDILSARVSEALAEVGALFADPVATAAATTVEAPPAISEPATVVEEVADDDKVTAEPVATREDVADEGVEAMATAEHEKKAAEAPTSTPKRQARPAKAARRGKKR